VQHGSADTVVRAMSVKYRKWRWGRKKKAHQNFFHHNLKKSDAILIRFGTNILTQMAINLLFSFLPHLLSVSAPPGERKRTQYCIFNHFGIIA